MIAVSDAWKDIHQRFLLSEGHIEIKCELTEVGLQELATPSGTNEAEFSNVSKVVDINNTSISRKYATNELNLWALDGSLTVLPDSEPYESSGYISDVSESGSVTLTFPETRTVAVPGVTITWSSLYGEYPPVFTVTAKNGDTVVAETTVTDNSESSCIVDLELSNYDSVTVTVHNWCVPYRRARIEQITIGHTLTLTKSDIISYTHEQNGDLLSGELPKNSISFSLNNIDGRWNPSNPTGIEKYLSERQKLTVKYGFTLDDGTIEWIKAGTFYLSEWNAPSNGLEAKFVARDIFEYLLNEPYTGVTSGDLETILLSAFSSAGLPGDFKYVTHPAALLFGKATISSDAEYTCAEVVQMCANAATLILYQDRDGVLHVDGFNETMSEYMIPISLSYSHPEIELSKPLKNVSVAYTDESDERQNYLLSVGGSGETQTVNNPFVSGEDNASNLAEWVKYTLASRKKVTGEFRADPRLDLFDIVIVESKYGVISPVAITNMKYTFNGTFHGSYEGRVLENIQAVLGTFILGKSVLGEVV